MSPPDLLTRAAVLSVFDLDWIHPHLTDAEVDDVADFLSSSCERVVDSTGTPRWRLRDDVRIRKLRGASKASLRIAIDSLAVRPDEPVQIAMVQYLNGSLPPLDQLDVTELGSVLQLERWFGENAGLPASAKIQARLDWRTLIEPLQRLVARGFFGRQDLLAELWSFIERDTVPMALADGFLIEGVGGSGKSTVLSRLILDLTAHDDLAVYISFDRGWLIDGGPWALFDEIVRQIGVQLPERRHDVYNLRQQAQKLASRVGGASEIASRGTKRSKSVDAAMLQNLAQLVAGRRLVIAFDTLEELARRDESFVYGVSAFLATLSSFVAQMRVIAAGRRMPDPPLIPGRSWHLTGLNDVDAALLLQELTAGAHADVKLLREIIRLVGGNPLSLHLAADVLNRTGENPARMVAVAEGNVQGQLYSRLLEHIQDPRVKAIAHPGLVVRRITPEIIHEVLAEPCRIAPLEITDAVEIFSALRDEATLCELSPDGDGALVHRQDVRALMLPSIQQDSPGITRAIHEAAVRYYEEEQGKSTTSAPNRIARREELYHRLMLSQSRPVLDRRWIPDAASDLAAVTDELPPRSQLYLTTKVHGLRLDPVARIEADDDEWQYAVRPAAMLRIEQGQLPEALQLVQERRGGDGRPLLADVEIEILERLGRSQEALRLATEERERAISRGDIDQIRALVSQQARILERMRRWDEAWTLLEDLAALDRARRTRTDALDDDVRIRELVTLTSLLRIARHEKHLGGPVRRVLTNMLHITRLKRRPSRPVDEITRETVDLAEATPRRLLTANPSLLRDLAAEIGGSSPQILQLAVAALANPGASTIGTRPGAGDIHANAIEMAPPESPVLTTSRETDSWSAMFREASDASQDYLRIPLQLYVGVVGDRSIWQSDSAMISAIDEAFGLIEKRHRTGIATPVGLTVVSALAEGPEQIAAQRALARIGARLEVVLPLPVDDYLEDFASDTSKNQFYALLGRATDIRHVLGIFSRSEAYERAGREIVDRCDVLLAIWDGSASRRDGGPTDIISYASVCRVPVLGVWIERSDDGEIHPRTVNDRDLPDILGPLSAEAFADFDQFNARSLDTVGKSVQQRLMPLPAVDTAISPTYSVS